MHLRVHPELPLLSAPTLCCLQSILSTPLLVFLLCPTHVRLVHRHNPGFGRDSIHVEMWIEVNTETSAVVTVFVQTGGAGLRNTRAMTTTAMVAVVLILPLVLATCGHAKLTDDAEHINNYGSCPLKKYKENKYGPKPWIFDLPPCGYLSTGPCTDLERDYMQMSCDEPFPDANFYHKDETVIATYFDDSSLLQNLEWEDVWKSSPCPLKLTYQWSLSDYKKVTESFDCPVTCYDCANLCR